MLNHPFISLTHHEAQTTGALFERMFPADTTTPGANAIGVVDYVDQALAGAYRNLADAYHLGLAALDRNARDRYGNTFVACTASQQDELLIALEAGALAHWQTPSQAVFFAMVRAHLQEGLFADPIYGGNQQKQGWATFRRGAHSAGYLTLSHEFHRPGSSAPRPQRVRLAGSAHYL